MALWQPPHFFWTFRRESRNGRPQKYARYKHVLWRRSRASRPLDAVHRAKQRTAAAKRNKKSSKKATQASRSCVKVHRGTALSGKCRCQPKVTNHHKHEPKSARDENMRSLLHESFHAA
jgi:hypothetical protein